MLPKRGGKTTSGAGDPDDPDGDMIKAINMVFDFYEHGKRSRYSWRCRKTGVGCQ
jgi:hypothetical protein